MIYDSRITRRRDRARALSKELFGAWYRLEIGAALRSGEPITGKDLSESLGEPPSRASVDAELKMLEACRLLERLPGVGADRRVFLRPVETSYWETCRQLAEFAHHHEPKR